jgi:hypothetical protein
VQLSKLDVVEAALKSAENATEFLVRETRDHLHTVPVRGNPSIKTFMGTWRTQYRRSISVEFRFRRKLLQNVSILKVSKKCRSCTAVLLLDYLCTSSNQCVGYGQEVSYIAPRWISWVACEI